MTTQDYKLIRVIILFLLGILNPLFVLFSMEVAKSMVKLAMISYLSQIVKPLERKVSSFYQLMKIE